jgi:hypothetical protein
MSLFWWGLLRNKHSSKKGVAADLGVDLGVGEAKDIGNNISTCHWFLLISNRFCSHSFHSFLRNSSSKHEVTEVEEDFN